MSSANDHLYIYYILIENIEKPAKDLIAVRYGQ